MILTPRDRGRLSFIGVIGSAACARSVAIQAGPVLVRNGARASFSKDVCHGGENGRCREDR